MIYNNAEMKENFSMSNYNGVNTSHSNDFDSLTGLISYDCFMERVDDIVRADLSGVAAGKYAFLYLDVLRFKVINDIFNVEEGDRLLIFIASHLMSLFSEDSIVTRVSSDRFAIFTKTENEQLEENLNRYLFELSEYELPYEIVSNIGIYITSRTDLPAQAMLDRAILAHSTVKGDYIRRYAYYTSEVRDAILGEHEITGIMNLALETNQFVIYYQPQFNHIDKTMVGAEALVRWIHPQRGVISPGKFIPIFEKNGFITKVDLYIFEQVCRFIKNCLEKKIEIIPISVNISRRDIYHPGLAKKLEEIRIKYDVPVKLIRLEVTESATIDGIQRISDFISEVHRYGYVVEMDDFGSAYSSLNSLKSIDLDILKLDMKFLSDEGNTNNGSIILSSVVRMAKWLGFPIIAEGVENKEQADFLLSIGSCYVQGYLYSKPVPEDEFMQMMIDSGIQPLKPAMNLINKMNANNFWDPKSLETMIFSNYVGGAAIYEYKNGNLEILRVNRKYIQEIGNHISETEMWKHNFLSFFDDENREKYIAMLERAIESEDEEECETWRNYTDNPENKICIRDTVRVIGKSIDSVMFYNMIRNVTAEKRALEEVNHREMLFRSASEQANIYYWEYNIGTKKMYPCFRCMRDLALPKEVENYPEPAIKMGIFPPEVADAYREIHKRIDAGEKEIEVDMPLTSDRVMFRVRYTTQFDENGNPIKAYGSATKI